MVPGGLLRREEHSRRTYSGRGLGCKSFMHFPHSLSWAVLCGPQQASFFFTSKYQLETDLSILSTPCHLFPWFHPDSLLGLLTVGSSPKFVFLQQVHEMAAIQVQEESDRCLFQVNSVYIAFMKAPFPGTGFSLLGPENSMLFLTNIGGRHKPWAAFRAQISQVSFVGI